MGTLGSTTWPQQALTTMLRSRPATQEPAPTDMGILATLGMELAMLAMLAMVALTELDMVAMELAMVVLTELDMLAMELGTAMAILATPATVDKLGMVQPTQVMLDIEFSARSNMDCSTVIT